MPSPTTPANSENAASSPAVSGDERHPRPAHTPEALREAVAALAPERLQAMRKEQDEAFAQAVEWDSTGPLRSWLLAWAQVVEIERRPDLKDRHDEALHVLHAPDSSEADAKYAADRLSLVLDEAMKAVRG